MMTPEKLAELRFLADHHVFVSPRCWYNNITVDELRALLADLAEVKNQNRALQGYNSEQVARRREAENVLRLEREENARLQERVNELEATLSKRDMRFHIHPESVEYMHFAGYHLKLSAMTSRAVFAEMCCKELEKERDALAKVYEAAKLTVKCVERCEGNHPASQVEIDETWAKLRAAVAEVQK